MVVEWDFIGKLAGGDWNMTFMFQKYWECCHPNWLSYFSEGVKPSTSSGHNEWNPWRGTILFAGILGGACSCFLGGWVTVLADFYVVRTSQYVDYIEHDSHIMPDESGKSSYGSILTLLLTLLGGGVEHAFSIQLRRIPTDELIFFREVEITNQFYVRPVARKK